VSELVVTRVERPDTTIASGRSLIHPLILRGVDVSDSSLANARATAKAAVAELPRSAFELSPGEPALRTEIVDSSTPWRENP
jgi:hypothetical protein